MIKIPLRTFLLTVVCLILVPLLGVACVAIWWAHEDERRNMEQALLFHARSLAVAIDREIDTTVAGLRGLTVTGDLDAADPRTFYEQARHARDAYRRWLTVALVEPSGRQVMNLLRPAGSPLPSAAGVETVRRTVETGEAQVSDLVTSPISGRPAISVTLPVLRDGKVARVLVAVLAPEAFGAALAAGNVAGGTVGTIVDRHGIVIATTQGQADRAGQPATAAFVSRARESEEAVFAAAAPDGSKAYTAFSRAPWSRFAVGLTVPAEQVEGPLRRSLWLLSAGALAGLGLSLGLATLAGRQFAGRLRRLMAAFHAFGRGETVPALPVFHLRELSGVTGALRDAMAVLEARTAALRESEARYRSTFERNAAGMCLTRADGTIVDCNQALARILGFGRAADVLTSNIGSFYAHAKERDQLLERVRADGSVVNEELQFRRLDGRLIWVLASVSASAGSPQADFETTLIDITEQKAADELRSVARLANAAAHEINNPLTMVLGRLALLRDDPSLPASVRTRAAEIHAAAERIHTIVVDMNHLTRVQLYEHAGSGLPEMLDIRRSASADRTEPPRPG